jgi:hypothetical protein
VRVRPPSEWEIALSAQSEILGWTMSLEGIAYREMWLDDRDRRYGRDAMIPSGVALSYAVDDLLASEPIYITDEMLELTYTAMESFRRAEPVTEEDFFMRSGFAYLAEPFMSRDAHGKRLAWRAIQWRVEPMLTIIDEDEIRQAIDERSPGDYVGMLEQIDRKLTAGIPLTAPEKLITENVKLEPVVRIILWSNVNDKDDYPYPGDFHPLKWGIAHCTAIPFSRMGEFHKLSNEGDILAAWLTFLRVMNKLMAEKITSKTRYPIRRPLRREFHRKHKIHINEVLVVELRRKTVVVENADEKSIAYSHRFIVHGFWRNQYYPSLKMHKQKYISDYVKGPDDKPLIIKKRIWVWKR